MILIIILLWLLLIAAIAGTISIFAEAKRRRITVRQVLATAFQRWTH